MSHRSCARVVGYLVLIYARPLRRIAFCVDDVTVDGDSVWLFQGTRRGAARSCARAKRVKRLGVRRLGGRAAASLTLAAALPPTLQAEAGNGEGSCRSRWLVTALRVCGRG